MVNLSNGELDQDVPDDKAAHMTALHLGMPRIPASIRNAM